MGKHATQTFPLARKHSRAMGILGNQGNYANAGDIEPTLLASSLAPWITRLPTSLKSFRVYTPIFLHWLEWGREEYAHGLLVFRGKRKGETDHA